MKAQWQCTQCGQPQVTEPMDSSSAFHCGCGYEQTAHAGSIDAGVIRFCPHCKTEEMYVQKDFPERVGVAIVVVGFIAATVAWAYYSPLATFAILFASFGIDALLFYTRKEVTVCYRCLAQFRGMAENKDHRAFDLGIGEKYRQERMRIADRQRQGVQPIKRNPSSP